jgi:subtilase family serine protease
MSTLKGSLHPLASARSDAGRMPSNSRLNGISIFFSRSAAQQADLEALIAAQQDPSSPLYHQWLTPEQFAARFGMSQADLDKVQAWLQQQGFQIDSVARSKNAIHFSGTASQVEQAFQTQMHYFNVGGERHFAPSTDLSVPAAIAPTVLGVRNLNDFRLKPMHISGSSSRVRPGFTSGVSGNVFFAPGDIKLAYDINPLLSSSYNGAGETIALMGQSEILNSDIEAFEGAAGLAIKDPNAVLVPITGSPVTSAGDESESDIDIEWSGGIAPGADIYFVYTGSNTTYGVFDSLLYAVDEKIGQILSISYGACEPLLGGASGVAPIESALQQAATQGQTVIAASGDQGSTSCFVENPPQPGDPTLQQQEQIAVNYPASSQYVTGMGGTEITAADSLSTNSTYWDAASSSGNDLVTSLKAYIPEVAWNDDTANCGQTNCLSSSGGGKSVLFPKPSWQDALTPADSARDVPDLALYASPNFPGYLYCTSDQSSWNTTSPPVQAASCNSGFRDSSSGDLTVAGGTSFAAPIFAGMLAIINQKAGYPNGQGLVNPTLYGLATSGGSYSAAAGFHDITSGNNDCTAGSTYCSSTAGYSAGAGYDQVTGLGSVDLNMLANAWPASTSTLVGTTTTATAASASPNVGTNDVITITVVSNTGATVPTGTVNLSIDGGGTTTYNNGGSTTSVTLASNGTATYTASFTTAGVHSIVAQYQGDTTHAPSTSAVSVTAQATNSGKGNFTLAATSVTVSQGSSGSSTITVTPAGGYTGTVYLTFDTNNDNALSNLCYDFTTTLTDGDGSVAVTSATAVTTQLQFDTNAADCVSAAVAKGNKHAMHRLGPVKTSRNNAPNPNPVPAGIAFAGLLLAGFLGRYSRKFRGIACMIVLASIGLALSACGGSSGTTVSDPPKGTYTVTVTGVDSVTSTTTAQTTFTFVID